MKKQIAIIFILCMLLSLFACTPAQNDSQQNDSQQNGSEQNGSEQNGSEQIDSEQTDSEQIDSEQTDSEQNNPEQNNPEQNDPEQNNPDNSDEKDDSVSIDAIPLDTILSLFGDMTDIGLNTLMHETVTKESAGFEMGYADFSGDFESAMALKPMMSTNPFVLIVYRLAEGADAAAFAADIEENADPAKWVCVFADKVFTRVSGRTVLFVMCPEKMAQPIADCFSEMTAEGFNPDEHIINPLADKTAQNVYDELYQLFSVEDYGFMDNKDISALGPDTAYGLSKLDISKINDSVFDEGYAAANDEEPERAYVLSIIKLNDGESAETFANSVQSVLDTSALLGGEASCVVAYGNGFVIIYAGTGIYGISASALESHLPITYRLMTIRF